MVAGITARFTFIGPLEEGMITMDMNVNIVEKIDALYDIGRDFVERGWIHGSVVENEFNDCSFDKWRKSVNDMLYQIGGCEDPNYQRFSKNVRKANLKHLDEGLRILAAVRDEIACSSVRSGDQGAKGRASCGRLSPNYY